MLFYHGTSLEKWEGIKSEGLRVGSYLADDLEVAEYYQDDVILKLSIPFSWVRPGHFQDHFVTLRRIPVSKVRAVIERS